MTLLNNDYNNALNSSRLTLVQLTQHLVFGLYNINLLVGEISTCLHPSCFPRVFNTYVLNICNQNVFYLIRFVNVYNMYVHTYVRMYVQYCVMYVRILCNYVSLSMVVPNSRDQYENVWLLDFCTSKKHFTTAFNQLSCIATVQ